MYPAELVKPMSQDLTDFGFTGLETTESVIDALDQQEGTTLLVVNSVCGCAAAIERHHIEGRSAQAIAENLTMAYDAYCK